MGFKLVITGNLPLNRLSALPHPIHDLEMLSIWTSSSSSFPLPPHPSTSFTFSFLDLLKTYTLFFSVYFSFLSYCTWKFFASLFSVLLVLCVGEVWVDRIWPEIAVESPTTNDWLPVNDRYVCRRFRISLTHPFGQSPLHLSLRGDFVCMEFVCQLRELGPQMLTIKIAPICNTF